MSKFLITKMFNKRFEICVIRCYKNSYIKISIFLKTQSEIICLCKDLDTIGHISNSTNKLLIGSWGSSSTSNFSIKTSSNHQTDSKLMTTLGIGSRNRPNHVASSISYSLSNWISTFLLFINQWIFHQWVNLNKFLWWDKISSNKLSDS